MMRGRLRAVMHPLRVLPKAAIALLGFVLLVSVVVQVSLLAMPLYLFQITDGVMETRSLSTFYSITLMFLAAILIGITLRAARQAILTAGLATTERKLFLATLRTAVRLSREGRPALASVALTDFDALRRFLAGGAVGDFCDLMVVPIPLTFMFMIHPVLGLVTMAGCLAACIFSVLKERQGATSTKRASALASNATSDLARHMARRDEVIGLGLLKGIVRHWLPLKREALLAQEAARAHTNSMRVASSIIVSITVCTVACVITYLSIHNEASPGSLIVSQIIVGGVVAPFDRISQHWANWSQAFASFSRLDETLRLTGKPNPIRLEPAPSGIQLDSLRLEVPGTGQVLVDDLNLHAPPGTVIAVTGRNGTGKSTFIRALIGLNRPAKGAVIFAGWVMHEADRAVVGPMIGLLSQRTQLLNESVIENISRLTGDTEGAILAARLAGAHDMIGRLPAGYSANAGAGAGLSGGQQRQIALARAFYGNPGLLVLDEPEVGLDPPTLAALVAGVAEMRRRGSVIFLVTHDSKRWEGVADLELRLEGGGAWRTALLNQPMHATA